LPDTGLFAGQAAGLLSRGQAYPSTARAAMGRSTLPGRAPKRTPRCRGYGVAPVGKVHSGTPLCAGEPIVVCSDWIQRVAFGEPRMM